MNNIALPKDVKIEAGENEAEGKVIIEPLFPGYGITLGNALRRVILSSLPGAAPVGVKIKGVEHEFMAMPHVKEDVLEVILSLKQLRLKVFSEEPVKLQLKAHGKKVVTAADIEPNSEVEIVNKDLKICEITDMSGSIEAELTVSQGMGYETIEARNDMEKQAKEIGFIEMDSIFSPILRCGLSTENIRVGKMTNWDRLVIDLVTDGTITPEQAFQNSVKILISQFSALSEFSPEEEKEDEGDEGEKGEKGAEKGKKDEGDAEAGEEKEEKKKKRGRPKKE